MGGKWVKLSLKNKKNILVLLYALYFMLIIFLYLKQNSFGEAAWGTVISVFILPAFMILSINLVEVTALRKFFNKYGRWLNIPVLLISPVISFLQVEIMVGNYNTEMFRKYGIYNIVWYAAVYFLLYALIRNIRKSVKLANLLIYLAACVNYVVYAFRGNPILPSDLLAWRTGVSVASGYTLNITGGFIISAILMFLVYALAGKTDRTEKDVSLKNYAAGLGICLLFVASVFAAFFRTDLIGSTISVLDFFAPKYTYASYGTAFGFVANVNALTVKTPDGYSAGLVESVFNNMDEEEAEAAVKPNIIAIMNESFSDLSMLGDYETNMDYLPYMRTLKENTIKGKLYVSVFGGATSDTEYEFLTGNSMAVMPRNSVPYQQFVTEKTDSLASVLKEQGYYNIAIHPYYGSGYKRDMVYPLLGFDEFLSMEDFKNPELIRTFISDRESYKKIIEEYEAGDDGNPLFIFNVTMQNHGGYSAARLFDEENNVRLTNKAGYPAVEQYLSLVRESDKAFKLLTDYFSGQEEPTLILLFGDHQPVVYSDFHKEAEVRQAKEDQGVIYDKKYVVPFFIWANYDIEEAEIDRMSANYLSSYLLQTAGLQGTEYNRYLLELYRKIPVINALFYIDRKGICRNIEEGSEYSEAVKEYRYVGYNNVFDKKDRLDGIYSINQFAVNNHDGSALQ